MPPELEPQPRSLTIYSRLKSSLLPLLKATLPKMITREKGSGLGFVWHTESGSCIPGSHSGVRGKVLSQGCLAGGPSTAASASNSINQPRFALAESETNDLQVGWYRHSPLSCFPRFGKLGYEDTDSESERGSASLLQGVKILQNFGGL